MGRSMILGFLEGLGDILMSFTNFLMEKLMPVFQWSIEAVFKAISYSLAGIGYFISVFMLQLIDLVQCVFRSLAGLDGGKVSIGIKGSTGSGDMLLNLLRSETVVQAFLSCCIVGIFLLIATTIFQIIKVEYTTEGAGNSKGVIVGKALKSLSNLFILPVLVIFGIFIGNQVLNLIDTATGGGKNTTMSGIIFATAASDVVWNTNDASVAIYRYSLGQGLAGSIITGSLNPYMMTMLASFGVTVAITESFSESLDILEDELENTLPDSVPVIVPTFDLHADPNTQEGQKLIDEAYNKFITNDSDSIPEYANILAVLDYYNIFGINYFLIIFASAIILKCMFTVCFGLIDRIFQSLVLFIISPMVIGMSPVKDSTGAWRTKFIQKVLSAYGVIISMNLFFTLIKLFLNLEVSFQGANTTIFSSKTLSGLVQIIFIITAAIGVEKLAGELGSYFGGGNALSDGKTLMQDTSKTITDATKTVTTAAKVGVGAVSTGAGIATKVGSGISGGLKTVGKDAKFGDKVKAAFGGIKEKFGGGPMKPGSSIEDAVKNVDGKMNGLNKNQMNAYLDDRNAFMNTKNEQNNIIKNANKIINGGGHTAEEKAAALKERNAAQKKLDEANHGLNGLGDKYGKELVKKYDEADEAQQHLAKVRDEHKEYEDKKAQHEQLRRDKQMTNYNALKQWGKDGLESLVPKSIKEIGADWNKAKEKGNSTDEAKQALENVKKAKEEQRSKDFENDPVNKKILAANRNIQTQKIASAMIEKAEFAANEMNKQMNEFVDKLNSVAGKLAAEMSKDEDKRDSTKIKSWEDDIKYLKGQMRSINKNVEFEGNIASNYEVTLDMGDFKRQMEEAIKRSASKAEIDSIIKEHLKKWGDEGKEGVVKAIKQAIEELKNEIGSK